MHEKDNCKIGYKNMRRFMSCDFSKSLVNTLPSKPMSWLVNILKLYFLVALPFRCTVSTDSMDSLSCYLSLSTIALDKSS